MKEKEIAQSNWSHGALCLESESSEKPCNAKPSGQVNFPKEFALEFELGGFYDLNFGFKSQSKKVRHKTKKN